MWTIVKRTANVDALSQLTDDQYMDALHETNTYFATNAYARRSLKLVPKQGPQSIEDRGNAKENYLGMVRRFKYYHYDVFISLLQKEGATLQNATERQFMTALEKTSELLYFKEFIRSRGEDITYRGPQSFVHKTEAVRISYRVQKPPPPQTHSVPSLLPERTRFFSM